MTFASAFIIAADPKLPMWQLPQVRAGQTSLLGWRVCAEDSRDSAVPEVIAKLISCALTRVARVTFPTSTTPEYAPSDAVDVLDSHGMMQRMKDWVSRAPRRIFLVSTREPASMLRLFDDGGFPWWMQGNVALLSEASAEPLRLDRRRLLAIMDLELLDKHVLEARDTWGILVPGVDGTVAALISRDAASQTLVTTALEQEARAAGLDWVVTSEDKFPELLRRTARQLQADRPLPGSAAG